MANQKYLFIQRSAPSDQPQEPPSEEQMQQMYAAFSAWQEKYKENIVDMGGRLLPGGKVATRSTVTDGPFVETKEIVGGDMIVTADSYDLALDIAKESPGVTMPGSSVEIREIESPEGPGSR